MGFWSTLGKGLLMGGAAIAAPFTGGASLATVIPAIAAGGSAVVGAMADRAASNRTEQGSRMLVEDQLGQRNAQSAEDANRYRAELDLRRREEERAAQLDAFRKAIRASLMRNTQDVKFDRSGFNNISDISFSGGLRPSLFAQSMAPEILERQALMDLMEPRGFTDLPDFKPAEIREQPKASFWEKIAGPVSMGLGMVDAYSRTRKPPGAAGGIQGNAQGWMS